MIEVCHFKILSPSNSVTWRSSNLTTNTLLRNTNTLLFLKIFLHTIFFLTIHCSEFCTLYIFCFNPPLTMSCFTLFRHSRVTVFNSCYRITLLHRNKERCPTVRSVNFAINHFLINQLIYPFIFFIHFLFIFVVHYLLLLFFSFFMNYAQLYLILYMIRVI